MPRGAPKQHRIPGVPRQVVDPTRTETHRFTVARLKTTRRLDKYLAYKFPSYSRSALQRVIRSGGVTVNGAPAKPSQDLVPDAEVVVTLPAMTEFKVVAEDLPLDILYQDPDVIIVNKPPNMVVHPGKGNLTGTLVNALLFHTEALSGTDDPLRPGLVHRLDKGTSGVLVVARNEQTHWKLAAQFEQRTVAKAYLAVVHGVPALRSDVISLKLGRHLREHEKMAVRQDDGREAETFYTVLETYGRYSLVLASPRTGRTHQIRVHLAAVGLPIVADFFYGRGDRLLGGEIDPALGEAPLIQRNALHAGSVEFTHPVSGERVRFTAPLFPDMAGLIGVLRKHVGLPDTPLDAEGVWALTRRSPDFTDTVARRSSGRKLGAISGRLER